MSLDHCTIHLNIKFTIFCFDCDAEVCKECVSEHESHNKSSAEDYNKCRVDSYKKKIEKDSKDSDSFFKLGRLLKVEGESIDLLLDGEKQVKFTSRELYLNAISLDPKCPNSYNNLGTLLKKNEQIQLLDGTKANETRLYLMAIDNDPSYFRAYYNIAITLSDDKTEITLLNGKTLTKQDLVIKAIELDPNDAGSFNTLGTTLKSSTETITIADKTYTKEELFLKSIDFDPTYPYPYRNLALILKSDKDEATLLNGTKMNRKQLLLKVIELDPTFSNAYTDIANNLETLNETIQLPNSEEKLTKQQLYMKSIHIDEKSSFSYFNLSLTLKGKTETIRLMNGSLVNKQQLLCKAIEYNQSYAGFYNSLGLIVKGTEVVELHNGEKYNEQQLFYKACELDPTYSHAYNNIATTLSSTQVFKLPNGEEMNKQQLFIKAISLNKNTHDFWNNLAGIIEPTDEIQLLNGKKTNKRMLLSKTIKINPKFQRAHTSLLRQLVEKENNIIINSKDKDNNNSSVDIDKEIQKYYDQRIKFFKKPITIYSLLDRFSNEFSKNTSFSDDLSDLFSMALNTSSRLGVNTNIYIKSLERFLMEPSNCKQLASRVDRNIEIDFLFQPLKMIRLILETFGDNPVTPSSSQAECKYLYQQILFKLIDQKLINEPSIYKTYVLAYLIDIVEYFDKDLNLNSSFIYKEIKLNLLENNNTITNNCIKESLLKSIQAKIKGSNRINDKILSVLIFLQLPGKNIEAIVEILNDSKMQSDEISYQLFLELGEQEGQEIEIMGTKYHSPRDLYLKAIQTNRYGPESYFLLGKLLLDNETIKLNGNEKQYNKFELYKLSIQLGNRDSSVFYHLAMLIGSNSNTKVKLPILNEEGDNNYYGYFDLLCQAIYHSPITYTESTHRYYLSLIRFLK